MNINGTPNDDILIGTENEDFIHGLEGNDTLNGMLGVDTIYGGEGIDTLIGAQGEDYLYGGSGNDTYVYENGFGFDFIDENIDEGFDTLHITGGATWDNVRLWADISGSLNIQTADFPTQVINIYGQNLGLGTDVLNRLERIIFDSGYAVDFTSGLILKDTEDSHSIFGSALGDNIWSNGGDDTVKGYAGNDTIYGGEGKDTLQSGAGDDTLIGEGGDDTLEGGEGIDNLVGGEGDDTLDGGAGIYNDVFYGGVGTDTITYKSVQSSVFVDLSQVNTFQDTQGAGFDYIGSIENLIGSSYDDTLKGDNGSNILNGGAGKDILEGGEGVDTVDYSDSTSVVNVNLRTGLAASASVGNDTLISIENVKGSDLNDQITVNNADNVIWGNGGLDTVLFLGTYSQYTITNIVGGTSYNCLVSGIEGVDTLNDIEKILFSDGYFQNGIFTSTINVNPVLGKDSATVDEDSSVTINVLANDRDANGDVLTVTAVSGLKNGAAVINLDNTITYTPNANYYGAESFLYTVSDGQGGTASQRVNITINSILDEVEPNFIPVLGKDNVAMDEDTSITINVLANDRDANGDALTVISVNTVRNGTTVINSDNTITYTPIANFNGIESFLYTVSDGQGGTATQRVNVTINPMPDDIEPNFAPVLGKDSASVNRNGSVTFNVLANDRDADGDALTITSLSKVLHGTTVLNADQTITYVPNHEYSGSESFTYTVNDAHGGIATQRVNISVIPNVAPSLGVDNFVTHGYYPIQFNVLSNDSDINGDTLTVTAVSGLTHGTVAVNLDNTVTYLSGGYVGSDSFEYTVNDGHGGIVTQTANITINENAPPTLVGDNDFIVMQEVPTILPVLANDTDADGDKLTVIGLGFVDDSMIGNASIFTNNGNTYVKYTGHEGYSGPDSFVYGVEDGRGEFGAQVVRLVVQPLVDNNIEGSNASETINGSINNGQIITALGGNDIIFAGPPSGNAGGSPDGDYVRAGDGNDIIYNWSGNTIELGQGGADHFVITNHSGGIGQTFVLDFNASEGDKIDIVGVLSGYDPVTSAIEDFISLTTSGFDTIVNVDRDGSGAAFSSNQVARAYNATLTIDDIQYHIDTSTIIA